MLSQSSITSRRQARGWARSFLGQTRVNRETHDVRETADGSPAHAVENRPAVKAP